MSQRERLCEPRDFVEDLLRVLLELPRALVAVLRFVGAPLRAGFLAAVLLLGFVAAERLVLLRLEADEAFFLETRLFPLRGLSLPVTASTNAVTALDAISFVAAMFILAASVTASGSDVISPSFSLSIVTSLGSGVASVAGSLCCTSGGQHLYV